MKRDLFIARKSEREEKKVTGNTKTCRVFKHEK